MTMEGFSDEDEEPLALSSSTMEILNQFLAEKQSTEEGAAKDPFAENWGMSQFWYTDETARKVAQEVVTVADGGVIACMACPSLFRCLKQEFPSASVVLFEYDTRFQVLGDFCFWDYNCPSELPQELRHSFDVLITDPPYLSAECFQKAAESLILLGKEQAAYFALTGASVRDVARSELNLRPVAWRPEHKNKLGNEFCFYTRSEETAQRFGGWDTELS